MTKFEINLDDYLSHEEKKELARDVFAERLREAIRKEEDLRRILSNISYDIVSKEVEQYIPDYKDTIAKGVISVIEKEDLSYHVFHTKNEWGREDSTAYKFVEETIKKQLPALKAKVEDAISKFSADKLISEKIAEVFADMAENAYKLSQVFYDKNQQL